MPVQPSLKTSLATALALALSLGSVAFAQTKPNRYTTTGVEVSVTPEMTGAGAVSSGVTLPKPPPVTGSRANPVAHWASRCRTPSSLPTAATTV